MKILLFLLVLVFSSHSQADFSDKIDNIFDLDINKFCEEDKQNINIDGVKKEIGCLNDEGTLDGIWFSSAKGEIKKVSKYENGEEVKVIYGIDKKSESLGITRLLSNPKEFAGKKVRLRGYYANPHRESSAVYRNHIDAIFADGKEGIWIELPKYINKKDFNGKYILIEGEFSEFRGHMGAYCCGLNNITRIEKHGAQLY